MRETNRIAAPSTGHERRKELMASLAPFAKTPRVAPMAILLGFLPFIAFALLSNVDLNLALWIAFAAAFVVSIRDFAHSRLLRMLDLGSVALFGILSLYAGFIQPSIPIQMARLVVDGGLFVMAVLSLLMRHPLTLQYAREQVPEDIWQTARFISSNYVMTGAWAASFALMAAADAVANKNKDMPVSLDVAVSLIILAIAILFTARYPHYLRAHAAQEARKL
jgi:hypothetical protein